MVDNPLTYGDPNGFREYMMQRGRSLPASAADDDQVTAALVVASEWLDNKYRTSYSGYKYGLRTQIRDWPRYDAIDVDRNYIDPNTVPDEVQAAAYEATFLQLSNPGVFSPTYTPPKYTSARIEGAISVTFAQLDAYSVQSSFTIIDQAISRVLGQGENGQYSALSGLIVR